MSEQELIIETVEQVLLKSILLALQIPRNADTASNSDRVLITNSLTIGTLPTLALLTNLTQFNGHEASRMSVASEIMAWQNVQRSTIS